MHKWCLEQEHPLLSTKCKSWWDTLGYFPAHCTLLSHVER